MLFSLDATEDITFAAVGRALTAWEVMEASLADLYSIFCGAPLDRRAITFFGHRYGVTARRLVALEKAAFRYFCRFPHQDHEHAFMCIRREVEISSIDRHRIAHGLVERVHFMRRDGSIASGFALTAPWYAQRRLRFFDEDAWSSHTINEVSDGFAAVDRRIMTLSARLLSSRGH